MQLGGEVPLKELLSPPKDGWSSTLYTLGREMSVNSQNLAAKPRGGYCRRSVLCLKTASVRCDFAFVSFQSISWTIRANMSPKPNQKKHIGSETNVLLTLGSQRNTRCFPKKGLAQCFSRAPF